MSTISLASAPAHARPAGPFGGYLALLPASITLVVFFALPMGMMIGVSLSDPRTSALSLASYERFLSDGISLAGLGRTALMSMLVAVSVTVLAYPVAYFLARCRTRWRALVFALALAP